jgi:hypothetical protein
MSRKSLDALLRKREALEREIAAAQAAEKRKTEVVAWPEFANVLALPDEVLRAGLAEMVRQHSMQN